MLANISEYLYHITKQEYVEYLSKILTKEMHPFLADLVEPCDCGGISGSGRTLWRCQGWKLTTMWKADLPKEARAVRRERK